MTVQWPQLLYSLLVCFGGGTLAFLGISEATRTAHRARKAAAIAAALLLLLGGAALVISVGGPERAISMLGAAARGNTKSLAIIGTIVCLVVAIAYAVIAYRADSYAEEDEEVDTGTAGFVLGIAALVCGVVTAGILGHADAPVFRVSWTAWAAPLAYVANALLMGGALFVGIMAILDADAEEARRFALYAIVAGGLQTVAFLVFGANASFAFDPLVFWVGCIVIGCVVPIACLVLMPKTKYLVFGALAGSVVGGICIRLAMAALASGNAGLGLIQRATEHASIV